MLVGEPDGQSFGVGVAPRSAKAEPSSVVQLKKKEEDRKRKKLSRDTRRYIGMIPGKATRNTAIIVEHSLFILSGCLA